MSSLARKLRRDDKIVGFVPTMGSLHKGHISLVKEAHQMCDVVIVSVFVNPTQFNKNDDLENYPRDLPSDAAILAEHHVDYIFAPEAEEIYGENFSTFVTVDDLSDKLEGVSRPGHFRGVATVLAILLNTIRPDNVFFGQKDAQQVAVVEHMTHDLGFDVEIVVMPIVREKTGLAMSSRNERLSNDERQAASIIYEALLEGEIALESGERNASKITETVRQELEKEPLANIDYIAVVDNATLEPIDKISIDPVLIAVAASFGEVRLIDNIIFTR